MRDPSLNLAQQLQNRVEQEPQSWNELLSRYEYMRQEVKPIPAMHRVVRERSFEWRGKQREWNPVLQQFIAPEKEIELKQQEENEYHAHLDKALQKTKRVKHMEVGWIPTEDGSQKEKIRKGTKHANDECKEDRDSLFGKKFKAIVEQRQRYHFNIVTNENQVLTKSIIKGETVLKEKKHFDKMYEETSPREPTLLEPEAQFELFMKPKPPLLKNSEGQAYDLLKYDVKKPEILKQIDDAANVGVMKKLKRMNAEKRYIEETNQKADIDNKRRIANKSGVFKMFEFHQSRKNYDIIQNKPYTGLDKIEPIIPLNELDFKDTWDNIEVTHDKILRRSLNTTIGTHTRDKIELQEERRPVTATQTRAMFDKRKPLQDNAIGVKSFEPTALEVTFFKREAPYNRKKGEVPTSRDVRTGGFFRNPTASNYKLEQNHFKHEQYHLFKSKLKDVVPLAATI